MEINIRQCFLTKNECYTKNQRQRSLPSSQQDGRYRRYYQGPTHIVVHSTGVNNPWLLRYVQPDDGILGINRNGNSWNNPGLEVCVNAFIGKTDNGDVAIYQTLPWEYRPWGVGSGKNGSYNDCAIQFEICEDNKQDYNYFKTTYEKATELCAYLCKEYNIPVNNICSHAEAHKLGYGSDHVDPTHWWKLYNVSMDDFRARVQKIIEEDDAMTEENIRKICKEEIAAAMSEENIRKICKQEISTTVSEERIKKICKEEISAAKDGGGTGNNPSAWAKEATDWAVANGIINGFGGNDMGWKVLLTREQMATMLYRYAKLIGKA